MVRVPFPWIQFLFFAAWLLAGVRICFWYLSCLGCGAIHVYSVNGDDAPVTVYYDKVKVATLRPDETKLIKLSSVGGELSIQPSDAEPIMERVEKGLYLLNIGNGYWVSSKPLSYFRSFSTTTIDESRRHDDPGLFRVSEIVFHPSAVCAFGEDVPGSMDPNFETPQYALRCGSHSGRKMLPATGWLGVLTMPHEWGVLACVLPGLGLAIIWFTGLVVLLPRHLPWGRSLMGATNSKKLG